MGRKVRVNWGSLPEGEAVKLHVVYNTADRKLYVLAADPANAMRIAQAANHVRGTLPITELYYDRIAGPVAGRLPEQFEGLLPELTFAISKRLQGTLHVDDGKLTVGYELIDLSCK